MKQRVLHELDRIERQHKIRNLLAVESGSTAWGFASPDSDYDVRFIYAHERDWYLSVLDVRDVMEEMMPDRLDFSGWDLRKTLRLFSKCNLALNEWLGSPVVYTEALEFRHRIRFARCITTGAWLTGQLREIWSMAEYKSRCSSTYCARCSLADGFSIPEHSRRRSLKS